MIKFSKNAKLNGVLNEIALDIMEAMDQNELLRYMKEFKNEPDYNIAEYGNLLIYYYDIEKMYKRNGYKTIPQWSNQRMWKLYRRQVGYVARYIAETIEFTGFYWECN